MKGASIIFALAVVLSHVEAVVRRIAYLFEPPLVVRVRSANPHRCRLCGSPMYRDVARAADTLRWWRCGSCHRSLVGLPETGASR